MIRLQEAGRVTPIDHLRPPSPLDLQAAAGKDWLHLNIFVADRDIAALVNVSLHGDPSASTSLAVGTTLVVDGQRDVVYAGVDVRRLRDAELSAWSIEIAPTASVDLTSARGAVVASGRAVSLDDHATPAVVDVAAMVLDAPIEAEFPTPFGSGWIGWRAVPRLDLTGTLTLGPRPGATAIVETIDLSGAIGYHDHNWGRWHWGDDIGWRWGTFPVTSSGDSRDDLLDPLIETWFVGDTRDRVTVTVAHHTDRHHRSGRPIARSQVGSTVRDHHEGTVTIATSGRFDGRLVRIPGAMAALRSDRQRPDLPARVRLEVRDGFDRLDVDFVVDRAVQLINADPVSSGHTFIHELFGRFEVHGRIAGKVVAGEGLGVFEHVD